MAFTFTYTWAYLDSSLAHAYGEYTPGPDGSGPITAVHITNGWPVTCTFYVIQQFNAADPAKPSDWSDPTGTGVRVWPEEPPAVQIQVGPGDSDSVDVTGWGLIYKVGQTGWYGDEFSSSDGSGPIIAGGETGLALGS